MIEFRAREDWTASRISLSVVVLEKPNVGGSLFFDLSPEIAERLAQDLLQAVKSYRDLDKRLEKDLAPKTMFQKGCKVHMKMSAQSRGTVSEDTKNTTRQIPVLWDDEATLPRVSWVDVQDLMVVE